MELSGSNRFLAILSESIKLLPKNGKLMASVAILSTFLNAVFLLWFAYSVQSLVRGMAAATRKSLMPEPNSFHSTSRGSFMPRTGFNPVQITHLLHHLREDAAVLFAVEVAFVLAFSTISFFSTISTILISAVSYNGKNSSLKELFSMMWRSWTRPFITTLYVSGLSTAYFVAVFLFAAPLWIYPDLPTFWLGTLIAIPSFTLYFYLQAPWILSVVVAVVEESCYGLEALGRAATLVKGKRLHGFLLNMIYGVVVSIMFQYYRMRTGNKGLETTRFMLVMCFSSLVKIFLFVAYTVFYFHCKMHHGEEIELHTGGLRYTKLSTAVLPHDMP
ncbi:hypothetical protein C2S51_002866 [Perilla frutescens var. frutescens]|nr:hypothetical protein C2S51_002866 [Perilla frutescens var. frutescens]